MKSIPIILGLYILYYAGNIIYDLFLKKEKIIETENNEQSFSLSELKENPTVVGIEDVENIITPKSYEETEDTFLSANDENQDIEKLKSKFEEESNLNEEKPSTIVENKVEQNEKSSIVDKPILSKSIKNILSDIDTRVKMVANYEGQKVYHIQS